MHIIYVAVVGLIFQTSDLLYKIFPVMYNFLILQLILQLYNAVTEYNTTRRLEKQHLNRHGLKTNHQFRCRFSHKNNQRKFCFE